MGNREANCLDADSLFKSRLVPGIPPGALQVDGFLLSRDNRDTLVSIATDFD